MKPSIVILRKASSMLRELADEFLKGFQREHEARRLADLLVPKPKMNFPVQPVPEMTTAEIAEVVRERAGGVCEACDKPFTGRDPFSLDHWENGNGRRIQKQCVENCWGIHKFSCHPDRQEYRPGVSYWNIRFRAHCQKYGYEFIAHIEHQPVRRR